MSAELAIVIKASAVIGAAQAAISGLGGSISGLKTSTGVLKQKQQELGRVLERNKSILSPASIAPMYRAYDKLGISIDRLRDKTIRLQAIQNQKKAILAKRDQLKSEFLGTAALGAAAALPVKLAMDFESSMADVRKTVDFDTPAQFKQMGDDILRLTREIPMAGTELAQIAASGGQLGVAREDITDFTKTVAKMSVAFDMSASEAGDSMAKLANVYKIPIKEIDILGDAINDLSNNSPAKASDIVNALARVGGVAKQFGFTEIQAAALSNAMISLGKPPEIAARSINTLMQELMVGGKGVDSALGAIGYSHKQMQKMIADDAESAIMTILQQIKKLPKEAQMGVLTDLVGKGFADDLAILVGNTEVYEKSIERMKAVGKDGKLAFQGSMDKEFQARASTTAFALQSLKNSFVELGIQVGSVVLPALNDLVNWFKPIIYSVTTLTQKYPLLTRTIVGTVTALATMKVASFGVRYGFNLLSGLFLSFGGKLIAFNAGWLQAQLLMSRGGVMLSQMPGIVGGVGKALAWLKVGFLSMGKAALLSPITWIVLGIAFAGLMIYKFWKPIKAFFIGFWDGLKDGIAPILPLFEMLGFAFRKIWEFFKPIVQPILDFFGDLFVQSDMATAEIQGIGYLIGRVLGSVFGSILSVGQLIIDGWRMIFETLFSVVDWVWTEIKTAFSGGIGGVSALIINWSPIGLFYQAFAAVLSWFGVDLPAKFTDFGSMLITGLVTGIQNKLTAAKEMIQGFASNVKGWFQSALGIRSPSRVFMGFGGFITEGLARGIDSGQTRPLLRIGELANGVQQRFKNRTGELSANLSARMRAHADEFAAARAGGGAGAMTVHFNPTINAPGGDPGQIQTALKMSLREFEALFKRMVADNARRAY